MNHRTLAALLVAAVGVLGLQVPLWAQPAEDGYDVLVFHNAAGFVHASIPAAVAAFETLALEHGFTVTSTDDPSIFTDEDLAEFEVVAFVLTTADAVPETSQQEAFERWHRAGGGWMGVHSAADTEYDWPYYGELLAGGYFLAHPVNQPGTAIVERTDHPATAHLGETWEFPIEEFYSFVRSVRGDATVLVSMDEDSYDQDPNTTNLPDSPTFPEGVSGVMGDHPMVWCHDVNGGRAFYTAFGHEAYLYGEPDFRAHLLGGLEAVAGRSNAPCHATAASQDSAGDGEAAGDGDGAVAEEAGGPGLAATGGGAGVAALGAVGLLAAMALRRRAGD